MFFLPAISVEGRSGGQSMSKDLCSKCESELMIICDGEITKIDIDDDLWYASISDKVFERTSFVGFEITE